MSRRGKLQSPEAAALALCRSVLRRRRLSEGAGDRCEEQRSLNLQKEWLAFSVRDSSKSTSRPERTLVWLQRRAESFGRRDPHLSTVPRARSSVFRLYRARHRPRILTATIGRLRRKFKEA